MSMELLVLMVVIYLRVSTGDQFRKGFSIPEQRLACLEKARTLADAEEKRTGRKIHLQTIEFTDAISGEILERPELDKVREFIKENKPAYFVCLDPDRFSRETYHAIMVMNEIEAVGTRAEFVQFDYQHTEEGQLFFTLRVAIAKYEKAKIKERTARGKRGKIKNGGLPTGLHMYGYSYDRLTQIVTPHPSEAPWVLQIFRWASQGMGCQMIANRLNDAGVPLKGKGARWYRSHVSKILRNRGYVGEYRVNRFDSTGIGVQRQLPRERRTRKLTPFQKPREEWITLAIPPLITEELWTAATTARPIDPEGKAQRRDGLLSGLMRCGFCDGPVFYRPHATLGYAICCGNRYPYMRDRKVPMPVCKLLPYQGVKPIETLVWSRVCDWMIRPESILDLIQATAQQAPVTESATEIIQGELSLLERQLAIKQQEQVRVLQVVATGAVDPQVAAEQLAPYTKQIVELKAAIVRLQDRMTLAQHAQAEQLRALDRFRAVRDEIAGVTNDVQGWLTNLDGLGRQQLVRALVNKVIIYPKGACNIVSLP